MLISVEIIANRLGNRVRLASIRSSSPNVWNSLPLCLRDPTLSVELFKANLKTNNIYLNLHMTLKTVMTFV